MDNLRHILAVAAASVLMLSGPLPASADSETPAVSFGGNKHAGGSPQAALLVLPNGISYGVTADGGQYEMGEVFELIPPNSTDSSWRNATIYSFANPASNGGTGDGYGPASTLLAGPNGSLYGTTQYGGQSTDMNCIPPNKGCGTVFQLLPPVAAGDPWTKDILYSLNSAGGVGPLSLLEDSSGNLYGTTGTTVFELSESTVDGEPVWNYKVLYTFGTTMYDGTGSNSGLLMDDTGAIYGTSANGGLYNKGYVFTLTPSSSASTGWAYAQVYYFQGGTTDGATPNGGLLGGSGTGSSPGVFLWGTTQAGGTYGLGTLFQLEQEFLDEPYFDSIAHSFSGGSDGGVPKAGLFESDDGSYWGTASQGGVVNSAYDCSSGCGVVFEEQRKSDFTHFIYSFSTIAEFTGYDFADGSDPNTALGIDNSGTLYGLTNTGGTYGVGTMYLLADAAPVYTVATPSISPAAKAYTTAQTITIADSMTGVTIYYTTDGSKPTTSSAEYKEPFTVSSTETVKAIATLPGWLPSAVAHAIYTIEPRVTKPVFSLKTGTYSTPQMLTMSDATDGASIYYTTDGSNPSTSSTLYTGAITVGTTETIEAIAALTGYMNSAIQTASYTITGD